MTPGELVLPLLAHLVFWMLVTFLACRETRQLRREVARLKAELEAERENRKGR